MKCEGSGCEGRYVKSREGSTRLSEHPGLCLEHSNFQCSIRVKIPHCVFLLQSDQAFSLLIFFWLRRTSDTCFLTLLASTTLG